jgi:hypothetical protein
MKERQKRLLILQQESTHCISGGFDCQRGRPRIPTQSGIAAGEFSRGALSWQRYESGDNAPYSKFGGWFHRSRF